MALKIPGVPKPLRLPVQALARAAYLLRGAFVEAAEGRPIATILSQRGDDLQRAERVLDTWWAHLGLDADPRQNGCRSGH